MNKKTKTIKVYEEDHRKLAQRKLNEGYKSLADVIHKVLGEPQGG